jgi:hypothetical protein
VAEKARRLGFFEQVFDGSEPAEEVLVYLKGESLARASAQDYPQTTVERIRWKAPFPLLRHHFGLPTMEETVKGVEQISTAKALDVISLGIDQEAQENFFHPERQDPRRKGAGGVPVRSAEDYRTLFNASRHGNYPLIRTYSGTDDFVRLAEMYLETIHNAWCAIPLFWFNRMDGRGPWDLEGSIREHHVDPGGAREMCVLLGDFLRHTLGLGERAVIPLKDELAMVRNFLAIERVRFGARLRVEEDVESAAEACLVPPLVLQPLIENAVKHGIANLAEGGFVRLEARRENGGLTVAVENAFDPECIAPRKSGLGLANVRRRLETRYGERAALRIFTNGDRYRVRLSLPLEEK